MIVSVMRGSGKVAVVRSPGYGFIISFAYAIACSVDKKVRLVGDFSRGGNTVVSFWLRANVFIFLSVDLN
ncbi:hypothetical protein [Paramixta manurensis]|uniref:hypothetical protein n=1 Tax=Paramixta manurensis TaxID=2740817 RepID=UPI00156AF0F2